MLATQLFGRILRSTHDYVGFMKEVEQINFVISYINSRSSHRINLTNNRVSELTSKEFDRFSVAIVEMHRKAHSFNSLPIDKRWFERGERPKFIMDGVKVDTLSGEDIGRACEIDVKNFEAWRKWTPLLEGDWEVKGIDGTGGLIEPVEYLLFNGDIVMSIQEFDLLETLNDFIAHCAKQEIELVINPEFEI